MLENACREQIQKSPKSVQNVQGPEAVHVEFNEAGFEWKSDLIGVGCDRFCKIISAQV